MLRKDVAAPAVVNLCNSFDVTGSYGEITASGTGRKTLDRQEEMIEKYQIRFTDKKGEEHE